ncbi:hypothetical protein K3495_g6952 [Podosphaera aphanis]|nr:hypothetical protein K3495_g6952 [Podosphaera aphanis]
MASTSSCLIEQMASPSHKRRCDSPPYIYSNKSRCRPSLEARVDPVFGQRSAFPGLDDETSGFRDDGDSMDHDGIKALEQEATKIPNVLVAPQSEDDVTHKDDDYLPDGYLSKYEDGAFISIFDDSLTQDQIPEDERTDKLLDSYSSIVSRYKMLRTNLQQKPPADLVANLHPNHRTCVGPLNKDLAKWWIGHIKNTDPNPVQVATMDKSTVLRILGLLAQGTVLKSGLRNKMSVSRWAWSLLARLPESGDLMSKEISVLRELGKKAILISNSLRKQNDWETGLLEVETIFDGNLDDDQIIDPINDQVQPVQDDLDETEANIGIKPLVDPIKKDAIENVPKESSTLNLQESHDSDGNENLDLRQASIDGLSHRNMSCVNISASVSPNDTEHKLDDLLSAKARILQRICNTSSEEGSVNLEPEVIATPTSDPTFSSLDWNTRATIDMILTIVGELYGQRDLLEFRSTWEIVT